MLQNIKAVAFDIDGTLYPSFSLYWRLIPYVIKHMRFYLHFSRVRKILHHTAPLPDFYEYQARLLAEELGCGIADAKALIKQIVYDGLKPFFERIHSFKYVFETFKALKEAGYKIALLSDFPPEQKGNVWGVLPYCDAVLGSEEIGALKPSKYPFGIMAIALDVKPEEILYVGNSVHFDVRGAKLAGMKSAIIASPLKKILKKSVREADIVFSSYRKFTDMMIK